MKRVKFGDCEINGFFKDKSDDGSSYQLAIKSEQMVMSSETAHHIVDNWFIDSAFNDLTTREPSYGVLLYLFYVLIHSDSLVDLSDNEKVMVQYNIQDGKEIFSLFADDDKPIICFGQSGWTTDKTRTIKITISSESEDIANHPKELFSPPYTSVFVDGKLILQTIKPDTILMDNVEYDIVIY